MKVVIIGSNGQLGSDLVKVFKVKHKVISLTHADIEISDYYNILNCLDSIKPEIVINTAAYHQIIECENNPLKAFEVNTVGLINLVKISNKLKFKLIHYSTDYVFDGKKSLPYKEEDYPNPLNIYGISKLGGEKVIENYCMKYLIIRISAIYGKVACRAKGSNFIYTMKNISNEKDKVFVVDDEIVSPTPTFLIAKNSLLISENDIYGLYHMSCEGECSWYEFAKVIFETLKIKTPLISCKVKDFSTLVKRPSYSVLENKKLNLLGFNKMPYWKNALIKFLNENKL